MSSPFVAAVVQSFPVVFETKATLAKVRDLTADAARRGAKLVVFPDEDVILTAELDPADITRGKYDFDVVGHYARPDVFRLHVKEKPAPPVVAD
jgi:hypothetical protein